MINYGPPPPLPGASQRGEWGRWRGRKRALRRQTSWWDFRVNDVTFFFSFLALFCLKQEKPDFYFFFFESSRSIFFLFFFFGKRIIENVNRYSDFSFLSRQYVGEWEASTRLRPYPQSRSLFSFFFFLSFYVFCRGRDSQTQEREAPFQVESDSRDEECVSCSVFTHPPHPPNPSPIPPSQQGATPSFCSRSSVTSCEWASGLVRPGPPL